MEHVVFAWWLPAIRWLLVCSGWVSEFDPLEATLLEGDLRTVRLGA